MKCHSRLLLAVIAKDWRVLHIIAKHMQQNPTNTVAVALI